MPPTYGRILISIERLITDDVTITVVAGGDRIRPLFRHYCQNTQCLQYWIDSNDRDRFEEAIFWLYTTFQELVQVEPEIKLLIMANKQDLPNALTRAEIIARLNTGTPARPTAAIWPHEAGVIPATPPMEALMGGPAGVRGGRWEVQESVATTGDGLYEGMDWFLGLTGEDA